MLILEKTKLGGSDKSECSYRCMILLCLKIHRIPPITGDKHRSRFTVMRNV